jgi:hypothetical protein
MSASGGLEFAAHLGHDGQGQLDLRDPARDVQLAVERQRPAVGTQDGLRTSQSALIAAGYRRSGMTPIVYPHAWRSRRAVVTFGSLAPVS